MRRLAVVVALLIGACGPAGQGVNTTSAPTTRPRAVTTTTTEAKPAPIEVRVDDCVAPQVTFSLLCETYDLIVRWHVDRPPNPEGLARAALEGLLAFDTDVTETPPRALICAIPHPAFESLCTALALRVDESSIPIGAAIEQAVTAMIDARLDPFSYYVPPDQVGAFRANGVVGGVGVLLDANDAAGSRCARVSPVCRLTVVFVLEDNAGADAGLQAGDVIVSVDGADVNGLGFVEAGSLIAGTETGQVDLGVERNGIQIEISVNRRELTVPTVQVESPRPGVGYIRIPDFESDIPDLVVDGLLFLDEQRYSTLIVDLRDNPGGFVDAAIAVISEFVDEGTVFQETGGEENIEYPAIPGGHATDKRLIVLVNRGTASAAELTAAALRDDRKAVVIGEPTFGKDAVQIIFDLKNGGQFHLAVARWISPDGDSVHGTGLIPDHLVDLPAGMPFEDLIGTALDYAG